MWLGGTELPVLGMWRAARRAVVAALALILFWSVALCCIMGRVWVVNGGRQT